MPELPEVETIRVDLAEVIVNKTITDIEVRLDRVVKGNREIFIGDQFSQLDRIGKLMIFSFKNAHESLLIHLKMTGQLIYQAGEQEVSGGHPYLPHDNLPNKHTRVVITFEDGSKLFFNDIRTFGYLQIVDPIQLNKILSRFGPDAYKEEIPLNYFRDQIKKRRVNLKAFLLNQEIIAGIGNIYVDELCFKAGVRPDRLVTSLSEEEISRLHKAMKYIIDLAVEHRGTSFRDYVDSKGEKGGYAMYAQAYKREGQPCLRCNSEIKKIRVAGRGTHFCEQCQN